MKTLARFFSPVKVGTMELKNRLVMSPMGTSLVQPDGSVTELLIDYYEARARGGVGLVTVGGAAPEPGARQRFLNPGIWSDSHIPGWRNLARALHAHGARLAVQLNHIGGRGRAAITGTEPVAPSPISSPGTREVPRELTAGEIEAIVDKFAEAARRLREAEVDAVALHGGHGYLISQFMSAYFNKRADSYGGDLMGRLRFPLEIIKNIKKKVGQDYPVIFRLSAEEKIPGGRLLDESKRMAAILAEEGADALDVSAGTFGSPEPSVPPMGSPCGLYVPYAQAIKKVVNVPVIVVGRINDPRLAEEILEQGQADLIAMGRPLICDPDLPNKAAAGDFDDIRPCIGCTQGCMRGGWAGKSKLGDTCMLNPAAGREKEMAITAAVRLKKVFIAGGGPAGLETARVAALRGHDVTLYERGDRLGGQLNIAAIPPFKQEITLAIKYFANQLLKLGVRVETSKEVTADIVSQLKPDVVVVATGGTPLVPENLPGVDRENVVLAQDLLTGKATVGNRVLIIGGGMVGCETADFLCSRGHEVTLVEMLPDIGMDIIGTLKIVLMNRLAEYGLKKITSTTVKQIIDGGVLIDNCGHEEIIDGMDNIVLAMGVKPVNKLTKVLKNKVAEIYTIGDACKPGNALEAIAQGAEVARKI